MEAEANIIRKIGGHKVGRASMGDQGDGMNVLAISLRESNRTL